MQNSFVLIDNDGEKGSVLWVAKVLLLCPPNTQTGSSETEYVFLRCIECAPALNEADKKLGFVCLKRRTLDEEVHSAVAGGN